MITIIVVEIFVYKSSTNTKCQCDVKTKLEFFFLSILSLPIKRVHVRRILVLMPLALFIAKIHN